ncbi:DNA-processing protein DprA [Zavarzinella formosa]|uniref:DNA-processing protein DprA n=1 Tax=Zavarzinella formosa TaxID=360055 RepID=UPI000371FA64|nr:DNA-processing protein DprA [Zavarzinella formosa]
MSPEETELHAWVTLTLVPGLGPKLTQALLTHFGSATAAVSATEAQLLQVPHIGEKTARQFAETLRTVDAAAEIRRVTEAGVAVIPRVFDAYPKSLRTLPDAPPVLYMAGDYLPADEKAVAIVGSRSCTGYGRRMARQIAGGLARAGYTVVSGLALGIDGEAHQGALEAGGRTLAVLAGGLSKIYPPEHVELAAAVRGRGALLTEAPMTLAPQRGMFHSRNRLISGLATAVVIIEANTQSGSLITARHAAEQSRELFVLPANVDSPASAGSLKLLRDGARLIRDADDLLEDLNGLRPPVVPIAGRQPSLFTEAPPPPPPPPKEAPVLEGTAKLVWELLTEPLHTDEICRRLGKGAAELSGVFLQLEMKKVIRRLPGNMYERR